jgi:hypothetical protein
LLINGIPPRQGSRNGLSFPYGRHSNPRVNLSQMARHVASHRHPSKPLLANGRLN